MSDPNEAEKGDFMTPSMQRPVARRTNAARLADRALISTWRIQGLSLAEIAQKTGLSYETVKRENRLVEIEWKARAAAAMDQIKANELAKLDRMEMEVWEQWQRSKADYQKRVVEDRPATVSGQAGRYAKIETGPQNGDPRYITLMLGIQERRARLLGLDAPTKTALTDPTGMEDRGPMAFPVPPDLTLEQWQAHCNAALSLPKLN